MKSLSPTVQKLQHSKVILKVKVDNRQTNRQVKNNMPPIILSGGIKISQKSKKHLQNSEIRDMTLGSVPVDFLRPKSRVAHKKDIVISI